MRRRAWMVVVTLATLAACGEALEDSIPGTWRNDSGTMTLRFFEDGTFATSAPAGNVHGRYEVAEDGTMRMEFDDRSAEAVVSVSEDKLDFCQPNHRCDEFQKVERK